KSCEVPVHPVSRSAPGATTNESSPMGGHVHGVGSVGGLHWPGHSAASVPSHSSPGSRWLLPQKGAHVQSLRQPPSHVPVALPSHCSLPLMTPSPQYGPHVQFAWHALAGHWPFPALPSHCSPASTTPLPQYG